ncbi:carotenoid biosynthesis protein [Chryseomicrobium sp. FSL W7-1435]|uniref:carotenoid biosynthesis protein n=1 Tax=Chryseomicrobium sp. FSL W7-1435 TaxID=2921704 RepID=UPI003159B3AE
MEKWKDRAHQLFLFWFAVGVVLVGFDLLPPWLEWANTVFLVLAGVMGIFYFFALFSPKKAVTITLVIYLFSSFMEYLGSAYGILFGEYDYTDRFGAKIFDIPFTIGFAWLLVMSTTHAIAMRITQRPGIATVVLGSLAAVVMDLIIDPVAFKANEYWIWVEGGLYYDIPWTNFMGWFVVASILHAVIWLFQSDGSQQSSFNKWEKRIYFLYGMMIFMFMVTAANAGLWLAIGLTFVLTILFYLAAEWRSRHDSSKT